MYLLFSELETGLLKLMRNYQSESSYWLSALEAADALRYKQVKKWHRRRKKEGVALDELDCFSLLDIFLVIRVDHELLNMLGDQLEDYEALNELRNAVSHSGLDIAANIGKLDQLIGSKRRLLELLIKISDHH